MLSISHHLKGDKSLPIETLKQFPLLLVFSDEELGRIQKDISVVALAKDEILFLEEDNTNSLYFILTGWLKAEKVSPEERQQTLRLMGPREVVNELSVFSNEDNAVSLIAMETSKVFYIPQSEVDSFTPQQQKTYALLLFVNAFLGIVVLFLSGFSAAMA